MAALDRHRNEGMDLPGQARDRALAESEQRFRLLVEGVKDYAIFMLDREGRGVSWNSGAERIKGYRTDEIVGQHFSRFYTVEDVARGKPQRELAAAAAEGRYEEDGWRVRKDGSRFRASVVITALRDATGHVTGFAKVTRDITGRTGAEDRLHRVVESAPSGMVMIDRQGQIVLVNAQTEKLFGYARDELLGQPVELLVPERYQAKHPDYRSSFFAAP